MKQRGFQVVFYRQPDGTLTGYRAQGHTGYAEAGGDIVCAAVSALTESTLYGLRDVLKAPVMFEIDERKPLLEAALAPEATGEQVGQAQLLLTTLLLSLQGIERNYPQNVRIIFEERR